MYKSPSKEPFHFSKNPGGRTLPARNTPFRERTIGFFPGILKGTQRVCSLRPSLSLRVSSNRLLAKSLRFPDVKNLNWKPGLKSLENFQIIPDSKSLKTFPLNSIYIIGEGSYNHFMR